MFFAQIYYASARSGQHERRGLGIAVRTYAPPVSHVYEGEHVPVGKDDAVREVQQVVLHVADVVGHIPGLVIRIVFTL